MDHQGNPSIVLKRVKLRIWNWGGWRVLLLKGMLCFVLLINLHTVPNRKVLTSLKGFLGSSAGKESSCKAGDSSLIRGSGRSPREWIGYPIQYSGLLVTQTIKKLLQCRTLGFDPWVGKIPWRRAWQPTPVFWPGESSWTEDPGRLQSMGSQTVRHD